MLCGKCLDGFSETFGSTGCQKCDNNYSILILLILIGFIYAFLLLFVRNTTNMTSSQIL